MVMVSSLQMVFLWVLLLESLLCPPSLTIPFILQNPPSKSFLDLPLGALLALLVCFSTRL